MPEDISYIGRYQAKPDAAHPGDYLLIITTPLGNHLTFDTASTPRGTSLRESAKAWCDIQGHPLRIDWSTLTSDLQ